MNWDYKKAGVSIEGGDAWVDVVKGLLKKRPSDPNQVGGVGGFSGLYRIGGGQCLAACCDGVGTKLEVAKLAGSYRGLGQDLVAMNVNDLITCGARPLFFLDYIACGGLDTPLFSEIIEGVLDACEESGCALLGGETAEMPGVYPPSGFDLAGFSVGIVDENKIIDGKSIAAGDLILALPSSGIHSNGFSLVRRVLLDDGLKLPIDASCPGLEEPLGSALLRPTRLYVRQAMAALSACPIHGMVHEEGTECPACKKEKAPRYKNPNDHQKDMLDAIDGLEDKVIKLLIEGKHDKNKRRHDHAANSLEEGFMWLRKAVMKNDDEV